jgi:hypothetical protein
MKFSLKDLLGEEQKGWEGKGRGMFYQKIGVIVFVRLKNGKKN